MHDCDLVDDPPTELTEMLPGENRCGPWVFGSLSESTMAVEKGDGGNRSSSSSSSTRCPLPHLDSNSSRTYREYCIPSTLTTTVRAIGSLSFVRTRTRAMSTRNLSSVAASSSMSSPQTKTILARFSASQAVKGTPQIRSHVSRYEGIISGVHLCKEKNGDPPCTCSL
ncbi:hypothetical protein GYH30_044696 [Glycine max]|uniref:Uncharacterized protein n=1 Tax=Glycine max TaxID=3847 RepID=A0A0R0FYW6_SOYBN|nr:hypothetical protein GYH30_044696 [Glycine max]